MSEDAYKRSLGRKIVDIKLSDEALVIQFEGECALTIKDEGQECCEERYMTTDDDLSCHIGEKLRSIELREVNGENYSCEQHDICFLEVSTDTGCFQVATHNEHNGYYGGFEISMIFEEKEKDE